MFSQWEEALRIVTRSKALCRIFFLQSWSQNMQYVYMWQNQHGISFPLFYFGRRHRCQWVRIIKSPIFFHVHYDVIKWNHFPRYSPFVMGIPQWPMDPPHKGTVTQIFYVFFLLSVQTNCWTNNRLVGNSRYFTSTWCASLALGQSYDYHYGDVIMSVIASQITSFTIVYSSVYSGADQRKHQSFASLAFVRGIHRRPVNSPHKGPVTRKMFPFDDAIMIPMVMS